MDLKNAVAVCLISLFSATLVVLIARSLDMQAAARLEPKLDAIAEELRAIRTGGGMAASPGEASAARAVDDGLMVYYFHGVRCPTCRAAEAIAKETLESEYASQLEEGQIGWKVLDYMNDAEAKAMALDFDVTSATLVLVKRNRGQIETWNRLDRVLALADDKAALSAYLQEEIDGMLSPPEEQPEEAGPADEAPAIPLPE